MTAIGKPEWSIVRNIQGNGTIGIFFTLSKPSAVLLEVYDIFGGLVKTFTNKKFEKGTHNISWDTKAQDEMSISSGLYFIHFKTLTPEFSERRKVVVLR